MSTFDKQKQNKAKSKSFGSLNYIPLDMNHKIKRGHFFPPGSKLLTISVGCFSGLRLLLLFASQKRVQLPWCFPPATGVLVWGHSNALFILDWRCEGQKQTTHTHPNTQKNPETFWALLEGLKKKTPFPNYFYSFHLRYLFNNVLYLSLASSCNFEAIIHFLMLP